MRKPLRLFGSDSKEYGSIVEKISLEQIRQFRLNVHHLDRWYKAADLENVVGACGFQNTPPGAWETALHNRIPNFSLDSMRRLLEEDKPLLQAWSFRGAPVVFPTTESEAFLSALIPQQDEPWIYTHGIGLALDFLDMAFEEVLDALAQVMPRLDKQTIRSKTSLDQTLAEWMLPLLPGSKRDLWNSPSMYGSPDTQTVGGAAVSFLLRPCSFMGLIVFGKRDGTSPTFTSYESWVGEPLAPSQTAGQKLVRKYLHCYGPSSPADFAKWLGCSPKQAKRLWQTVSDEIEHVDVAGKTRYMLSTDKEPLLSPPQSERHLHLLGARDPYLGLQDRETILGDKTKQRQIWQTVSNPGVILQQGEIAGIWKSKRVQDKLEITITWQSPASLPEKSLIDQCEAYAAFRQTSIKEVTCIS